MINILVEDLSGKIVERAAVPADGTIADVLVKTWPDGFEGVTPYLVDQDGHHVDAEEAVSRIVQDDEEWKMILLPQGFEILGVKLITWILAAVSVATLVLLRPKLPNLSQQSDYNWEDSDRPQFYSGQQNQVQPGRRIPDLFGQIRHYPDLMSTPAIEYLGNLQRTRELYVISKGRFDVEREQFFDDDLANITGATVNYLFPGDPWPSDFPILRQNQSVGGIELPAANEDVAFGEFMTFSGKTIRVEIDGYFDGFASFVGSDFVITGTDDLNNRPNRLSSVSSDGRQLNLVYNVSSNTYISQNVKFNGVWFVEGGVGSPRYRQINDWRQDDSNPFVRNVWEARGPDNDDKTWSSTPTPFDVIRRNDGVIKSHYKKTSSNQIMSNTTNKLTGLMYSVKLTGKGGTLGGGGGTGNQTSIFTVPGIVTEIWFDFEFPQGLYTQVSGKPPSNRSVTLTIYWRRSDLDTPPAWSSQNVTYSAQRRTPRRYTHKINVASGRYEVYVKRVTSHILDTDTRITMDSCQWIGLFGRQDTAELNDDVLNCTLADVTIATSQISGTNQRRFNVTGIRQLYDYRNEVWASTRKMSDAIMYTLVDMGNIPRENIDEASLYAIQDDLDAQGADDGEFSAVVDQTMTIEDQVALIAGVSRTMVYRRGSTFYFRRLKSGEVPVTLVNARNKIEPEQRSFSFSQLNEPDGIVLRYRDRENDYKEQTYQYPEDITPIQPEEQTVLGLCKRESITRMAQYNWFKRKYERDTIKVTMTEEGALLAPGDVISVTDFLQEVPPLEGEILQITNGDTFTFDQEITVGTYMLRIRDEFGDLVVSQEVTITLNNDVITIPELAGQLTMPQAGSTVGLIYSFEEVQVDHRTNFYVVRVQPTREGAVEIEALEYRDETYQGDTAVSGGRSAKRILRYDRLGYRGSAVAKRTGRQLGD